MKTTAFLPAGLIPAGLIPAGMAALALGACALTPNGPQHGASVQELHPITVDQQVVALRVGIDETRQGLGRDALAAIDGFVSAYRTKGHGPLTVTAPVGGASDRPAQEAAARVRAALNAAGVPYEDMRGASMRAEGASEVIVSFQSYVATGPSCGANARTMARQQRNLRSLDFGCASQANLAAMIADPRDLHAGAAADGSGDDALVGAVVGRSQVEPTAVTYQAETGN